MDNGLFEDTIHHLVDNFINDMLINLPSFDKVNNAIFGMNPNSAQSHNDFGAYFFQKYWDVIDHDIFQTILQFFVQDWIVPNYNSNVVALISKIVDPSRMIGIMVIVCHLKFLLIGWPLLCLISSLLIKWFH